MTCLAIRTYSVIVLLLAVWACSEAPRQARTVDQGEDSSSLPDSTTTPYEQACSAVCSQSQVCSVALPFEEAAGALGCDAACAEHGLYSQVICAEAAEADCEAFNECFQPVEVELDGGSSVGEDGSPGEDLNQGFCSLENLTQEACLASQGEETVYMGSGFDFETCYAKCQAQDIQATKNAQSYDCDGAGYCFCCNKPK